MLRIGLALVIVVSLIGLVNPVLAGEGDFLLEQVVISPTPFRATIPTGAPPATAGVVVTPRPTATATEEGPPQLEAKEEAGSVNVRADADPESEILGRIRFGERYTVTGRYYRWLQIRFEPSPTRIAYVFEDLVTIIGDEAKIPDLTVLPTADDPAIQATGTWEALLQTPGAEQTMTAESRVIAGEDAPAGAVDVASDPGDEGGVSGVLPTFTYPPNIIAQAPSEVPVEMMSPTPDAQLIRFSVSEGVPPLLPILLLAGLGVCVLAISALLRK